MDWKIMAASFVALLVVSSVLLGGFGLGDFFSDIINTIGDFLGSSPFGGISATSPGTIMASVVFYPSNFSINTNEVNITLSSMDLETFSGEIFVDFIDSEIEISPKDTDLIITIPLQDLSIESMEFNELSVEDTEFEIANEKSDKIMGEGIVKMFDFSGKFMIGMDNVEFSGNVSRIFVDTGESTWELK